MSERQNIFKRCTTDWTCSCRKMKVSDGEVEGGDVLLFLALIKVMEMASREKVT